VDDPDARREADEVARCSDAYEAALRSHDIATLNEMFWTDPAVVRFGVADGQTSYDEVAAWRATASPIDPGRVITFRRVTSLAPGVVAVDLTFRDADSSALGRQSQTWIRTAEGWRIARAHVSVIPG
jgi:ketosteroid isomerase-like protein